MKVITPHSGSLIEVLVLLFPESSRNTLKSWIKEKRIEVKGKTNLYPSYPLKKGDPIFLRNQRKFLDLQVEILYEDRHLIIVNKPEGLLSVATHFDTENTLHNILKRRFYKQRVYPVHRLDRETSGLLVFAYSEKAKEGLKKQFQAHSIYREYRGIVEGNVIPSSGTWESLLKEDARYFVASHKSGKQALTHYKTLQTHPSYTYLQFILETGRKNQIRAQAKEEGFPIIGDKKYGSGNSPIKRLGLHAYSLQFIHPITHKKMSFISPIPSSFKRLFTLI